jgi:Uma2 family endonuclease
MIAQKPIFYLSPEDYLAGERISPIKHEYRQGHVYAMTGAKNPHQIIASNLIRLLGNHLLDSPCLVLPPDVKVRLEAANCYYYPDVVVTCDSRDTESTEDFILYPLLIIEILSKSTQGFDRGEKFVDYQTSPALTEYVLIHQDQLQIEIFRLSETKEWIDQVYQTGEEIHLQSVDLTCAISEVYRKVPGL